MGGSSTRKQELDMTRVLPILACLLLLNAEALTQIHVANHGDDANPGTLDAPVATLGQARSMTANGDTILLERGGAWPTETVGSIRHWGNYGEGDLPVVRRFSYVGHHTGVHIDGLHFAGGGENNIRRAGDGMVVENSLFSGGAHINVQGGPSNVTVRNNRIEDASTNGIFASGVDGLRIHGNTIIRDEAPDLWGHGLYIQASVSGFEAIGNHIIRANHIGIRANGGGLIQGNVVEQSPIGIEVGVPRGVGDEGLITAIVTDNVVRDVWQGTGRGTGYTLGHAERIWFDRNTFINGERRVLDIEDVRHDSQLIEIGWLTVIDAPGPSERALTHDAAVWLAEWSDEHPPALGDMTMSGGVDTGDVAAFVLALTDPDAYEAEHGIDPLLVGDMNRDGAFDTADVAGFVATLTSGVPVPEPGTATLLLAGVVAMMRRSKR